MKKILFTLFLIGFGNFLKSQESRYIQITVTDSVISKATQIIYEISFGKNYDYLGLDMPQQEVNPDESKATFNSISELLKKEQFTFNTSSNTNEENYTISGIPSQPTIIVTLKSENELKKLYTLLKTQQGVNGKIKNVIYKPLVSSNKDLYNRMYAKAINQATSIASVSGNKLGNLISVVDTDNSSGGYMDIYKHLMKSMPYGYLGEGEISTRIEEVKMSFKFELK